MQTQLTITCRNFENQNDLETVKKAVTGLIDWATIGGLPDNFNPFLRQNYGCEIYVTGSSSNSLEFTVNRLLKRPGK